MNKPRRVPGLAAIAATSLFLLTACGSSSLSDASSTGGSTPGGTTSGSGNSSGLDLTSSELQVALSMSGGKEGVADPTAAPVQLGYVNLNGGAPSFPEANAATDAVVKLVNTKLGGVDGHPVKLVECNIVSGDADAQKCAQQIGNDSAISSVMLGMTVVGTGPIYSTIGDKKSVVGMGPFNPVDLAQASVNYLDGNAYASGPGMLLYAEQYLKAKSLAVVYDGNDPGTNVTAQVISKLGQSRGIKVKSVPVSDSSQWSTALVSAGAQSAGAVLILTATPGCVPAAQAVQQSGVSAPVLAFAFCQDASVAKSLGDYPKWTYIQPNKSPIGLDDPEVTLYDKLMKAYAPEASLTGASPVAAQVVFAQVHALNQVGYDKLDAASIRGAIHQWTGPLFMGARSISCGQYAADGAPSVCDATVFPITYAGHDKWTDPTDGKGLNTEGVGFKK